MRIDQLREPLGRLFESGPGSQLLPLLSLCLGLGALPGALGRLHGCEQVLLDEAQPNGAAGMNAKHGEVLVLQGDALRRAVPVARRGLYRRRRR